LYYHVGGQIELADRLAKPNVCPDLDLKKFSNRFFRKFFLLGFCLNKEMRLAKFYSKIDGLLQRNTGEWLARLGLYRMAIKGKLELLLVQ
jgi:hypothetical protein